MIISETELLDTCKLWNLAYKSDRDSTDEFRYYMLIISIYDWERE